MDNRKPKLIKKDQRPQRNPDNEIRRQEISLLKMLIEKNPEKARQIVRELKAVEV